jgi:tRNA nucleotidyltransferase (CCA-adding enzyme)
LFDDPREEVFEPEDPEPMGEGEVRDHVARRGTAPLALRFDAPDLVADQLFPQLRRSEAGLVRGLEEAGFDPLRSDAWASESDRGFEEAVLLVELAHAELPRIERHDGPPVSAAEHARGFCGAYEGSEAYGPFLDGERYAVERERDVRTPAAFVEERLFDVALGAHVGTALEAGYERLTGEAVARLADAFGPQLRRYFEPRP